MAQDRHIFALGGGPFFSGAAGARVREHIFSFTGKKNPRVLLVPTATGDSDFMMARHLPQVAKLGCEVEYIPFFQRTPVDLVDYANSFDLVWVGGGNTKSMLAVWREWDFDKALNNAYQNGVVMGGISAGAICWFEQGMTDSYADEIRILPCMGWLKGTMCPHYDSETERRPVYQQAVQNGDAPAGYAADEDVFIHFKNEEFQQALTWREGGRAYRLAQGDNVEMAIQPELFV